MNQINKEVVLIFLLILLALWVIYPLFSRRERFNADGTIFVPVGDQRYGLRGEPIRSSDSRKLFIREDPHVLLSQSGGEMWISNNAPASSGMKGCKRVQCPAYGYDNLDQCWQCAGEGIVKQGIPDLWPRH